MVQSALQRVQRSSDRRSRLEVFLEPRHGCGLTRSQLFLHAVRPLWIPQRKESGRYTGYKWACVFSSLEVYRYIVAQSRDSSWCAVAPFHPRTKIKNNLSRTLTRTPNFRDTFSFASFFLFFFERRTPKIEAHHHLRSFQLSTSISGNTASRDSKNARLPIPLPASRLLYCLPEAEIGVSAANPAGPHHAGLGAELSPPTEKAENGTSTACQIRRTDELRVPLYRRMSAPPAFCADASGSQSCLARQDVVQSLAGVELDGTAATKNNLILIESLLET